MLLPATMDDSALKDVRVLDLSDDVAGAYCTKLLADLGATVLLAESRKGHPLRYAGPFQDDKQDLDSSGRFLHLCANKLRLTLDIGAEPERVLALAQEADLVVENLRPERASELGLTPAELRRKNPALVIASITPFGLTGPWHDWQTAEIVEWALGGYMYFGGHPEREPLMVPNNQGQLHAGVQASIAALAALWWAKETGEGQHIDVSRLESLWSAHCWTTVAWTHEGSVMRRSGPTAIECKDGWAIFMPQLWNLTNFVLFERPDLADDPRFATPQAWSDHQEQFLMVAREWCIRHPAEEVFERAQELRIACSPVYDALGLFSQKQLLARNWFIKASPEAGSKKLPGYPYKLSETPPKLSHHAPKLTDAVKDWPKHQARTPPLRTAVRKPLEPRIPTHSGPLAGVRIVELAGHWVAPLAGRYLADLGAEVIKFEPADRLVTRQTRFPGGQTLKYHYNRSAYFNQMNRNKYAGTVDLAQDGGQDLVKKLIKETDILIENNAPRVLRNFGLTYDKLRKENPQLIMASISAFGQTGPTKDYIAYGANIEGASGLSAVMGYSDERIPYATSLYYADPVAAAHCAFAIQAALHYRRQTGKGQLIDLSLMESGTLFFADAMLEYSFRGSLQPKRGNRHERNAPQGCYPSLGEDMWVVISVRGDHDWRQLTALIKDSRLDNKEFKTEKGRMKHHDKIDTMISEWTRKLDHLQAAELLQSGGVPAAPVLANWEMVSSLHAHERGFYVPMVHKDIGVFPYPGMPWKLSTTPGAIRRAAPRFGEHNRLALKQMLNLDDREINKLYEQKIISDFPPHDLPTPALPKKT